MDISSTPRVSGQRGAHARPAGQGQPGTGNQACLEFTPADNARERRILNLTEQMLAAQTTEIRRHRMELLLGEIKSRSANAVALLEQQKGLV